ncbi:BZ3500_MvSof-1268-A1-R1_Chr5-2g08096 [Microbotryum saponariae]|uniref:BZ3500_MvSof-1268-A1-R1_Chr5-2g08096 protein n=1 Tax=Microbotryum saponariae TaxID=289078 RepID=A0A2X0M9R8_9BASI|nr:BZ3500_MvSof-1268-A1-R1_Chr5-2g08096 [Microbotryum saponariae]SDA05965.1 BZ3501_MvSof-1269-A2-R1_Chr5-2g07918 [Microbotryum saponariae]
MRFDRQTSSRRTRCILVDPKDIVPKRLLEVAKVGAHHDEGPQETIFNPCKVGFVEVRFEDLGLDDEDVTELAQHLEAVVQRCEGEAGNGVLLRHAVETASSGDTHVWNVTPTSVKNTSQLRPLRLATAASRTLTKKSHTSKQGSVLILEKASLSLRGLKSSFFCFESRCDNHETIPDR